MYVPLHFSIIAIIIISSIDLANEAKQQPPTARKV